MKPRRVESVEEVHGLVHRVDGTALGDAMARRLAETRSLLRGHFLLQGGAHSDTFLRAGQLLYRPADGRMFGEALLAQLDAGDVDVVVSSEAGARFLAEPIAELLQRPFALVRIYLRRRPTRDLGKGSIEKGARALVVGDVVTSGRSLQTIDALVRDRGGVVVHTAALAVLAPDWLTQPRRIALLRPTWRPVVAAACPACKQEEALWPAYELA